MIKEDKMNAMTRRASAKAKMNASYGKDGTKLIRHPHKTRLSLEDLLKSEILRKEFIYGDTDSVKVTAAGKPILESSPEFEIDDYKLGAWGYELAYTPPVTSHIEK